MGKRWEEKERDNKRCTLLQKPVVCLRGGDSSCKSSGKATGVHLHVTNIESVLVVAGRSDGNKSGERNEL